MYRLVEKSDVFLSNLGADNLAKWELTYEKLRAINPRLVYAIDERLRAVRPRRASRRST